MIVLKRTLLQNESVFQTFQRLMKEPLPIKAAYKMKRYADKLQSEQKEMENFFTECRRKHLVFNEDGTVKMTEESGKPMPEVKDREELNKKLEDFMGGSFTIEGVHKLASFELGEVRISAEELTVLEPFIQDLDLIS